MAASCHAVAACPSRSTSATTSRRSRLPERTSGARAATTTTTGKIRSEREKGVACATAAAAAAPAPAPNTRRPGVAWTTAAACAGAGAEGEGSGLQILPSWSHAGERGTERVAGAGRHARAPQRSRRGWTAGGGCSATGLWRVPKTKLECRSAVAGVG